MDSAPFLLNSYTTSHGLCDKQGLEEPVKPVVPSLRHCPRNPLERGTLIHSVKEPLKVCGHILHT